MNKSDTIYLLQILQKYQTRDLANYSYAISQLKSTLQTWANSCFCEIIDSGSRAKGTAISLASDVDYLVSLKNKCNEDSGGLKSIYDSLYAKLCEKYQNVRKQNVSVRIKISGSTNSFLAFCSFIEKNAVVSEPNTLIPLNFSGMKQGKVPVQSSTNALNFLDLKQNGVSKPGATYPFNFLSLKKCNVPIPNSTNALNFRGMKQDGVSKPGDTTPFNLTDINKNSLEVDVTPARKLAGNTNDHSLYVYRNNTWQQTNIQKHINDISQSGRTNEIKLLKIWRELNKLEFPSIYLEYLIVNKILSSKSKNKNNLTDNIKHILNELSKDKDNPLYEKIIDPANSNNILSNLLNKTEKINIINSAKRAIQQTWKQVFY
ncbi:MAG: hypothetical protein HQK96_18085 [Nitrospirae bacterium]|nr:hypothetical protein [Nitrospirota bacterium]